MPGLDTIARLAALPLRLAWRVGEVAVSVTHSAVEQLPGVGGDGHVERPPFEPEPEREPTQPQPRAPAPPPVAGPPPPPPAPRPEPAPPAHVDRDAVVVAESADPGAADGPGAEVHVDEPWPGYAKMTAPQITAELEHASPATLGTVRLYEAAHRRRRSILEHVTRQLRTG